MLNVYFTWKVASLPSAPSVSTKSLPSLRKKRSPGGLTHGAFPSVNHRQDIPPAKTITATTATVNRILLRGSDPGTALGTFVLEGPGSGADRFREW